MTPVELAIEAVGWAGAAADPAGLSAPVDGQADRRSRRSTRG